MAQHGSGHPVGSTLWWVSLLSLGIDTRGKSRRLKINDRTSQQILGWTLGILTGQNVDDLDGDLESEVGYRSAFSGPVPTIQRFTTPEEAEFVAAQVQEWLDDGVAPGAKARAVPDHLLHEIVGQAQARPGPAPAPADVPHGGGDGQ